MFWCRQRHVCSADLLAIPTKSLVCLLKGKIPDYIPRLEISLSGLSAVATKLQYNRTFTKLIHVAVCHFVLALVHNTVLRLHLPSSCSRFNYISIKCSVCKAKIFSICTHQSWEDGLSLEPLFIIVDVAIHKTVTQCRMSMYVDVKLKVNILKW